MRTTKEESPAGIQEQLPWRQIASMETVASLGVSSSGVKALASSPKDFCVPEERKRLGLAKVLSTAGSNSKGEVWTEKVKYLRQCREKLRMTLDEALRNTANVTNCGESADALVKDILGHLERVERELINGVIAASKQGAD